jgi:hypothetical protein
MSADTDRISMLNDEPRKHLLGGGAVITAGIAELRQELSNAWSNSKLQGTSPPSSCISGGAKWAANPKTKNRNLMNYFFCAWMLLEGHVAKLKDNIASAAVGSPPSKIRPRWKQGRRSNRHSSSGCWRKLMQRWPRSAACRL